MEWPGGRWVRKALAGLVLEEPPGDAQRHHGPETSPALVKAPPLGQRDRAGTDTLPWDGPTGLPGNLTWKRRGEWGTPCSVLENSAQAGGRRNWGCARPGMATKAKTCTPSTDDALGFLAFVFFIYL